MQFSVPFVESAPVPWQGREQEGRGRRKERGRTKARREREPQKDEDGEGGGEREGGEREEEGVERNSVYWKCIDFEICIILTLVNLVTKFSPLTSIITTYFSNMIIMTYYDAFSIHT